MDRTGTARWEGDLQSGTGKVSVGSGGFSGAYSWKSRFENGQGTNPEELIAAAHAACFSMAFSADLSKAGHVPRSVETTARVQLGRVANAPTITSIVLETHADVPGIESDLLRQIAETAKTNCPVSKALAAVPITLRLVV